MKVLGSVFPIAKTKFGLQVKLTPAEFNRLKFALEFEPYIFLAFGYFTPEHLQEASIDRVCTLVAACDGELWEDVKALESWLKARLYLNSRVLQPFRRSWSAVLENSKREIL